MKFDRSISTLLGGYKLSSAFRDILPDEVIPYDKEEIAVDLDGDNIVFRGRKMEKMPIRRALGRRLYPGWSDKELDDATEKIRIKRTQSDYTFRFRVDVSNAYAECTDTPLHSCVNNHFKAVGGFYDIINGHRNDPPQNRPFTDAPLQLVELWKGTDKIGRALLWSNVSGSENGFFLDRTYPPEGKKDVLVDGKIVREMYHDFARKNNWTYRSGVGYDEVEASNGKALDVNLENFKNINLVPFMDTFKWATEDGTFHNYKNADFPAFDAPPGTQIIHKKPVLKKSINDFQNLIINGKIDLEGLDKFDVASLLEESATHPELIYLLPRDCKELFLNLDITHLRGSNWDTSNVTDMRFMFSECRNLKNIDVSKWDTSNVTSVDYMFFHCQNLENLDVSKWDTSNVTSIDYMFFNCKKLKTLDVSNWNTSNVTNIDGMFSYCQNLKTLDVSNWNTSNVIDMGYMFSTCQNLENLDVSKWDTSNVTNMGYSFYKCQSLKNLDVVRWNLKSLKYYDNIFENSGILKETLQIWQNKLEE